MKMRFFCCTDAEKVNSLPHERFDTIIHICNKMRNMSERMNHEKCDAKSCSWPVYHDDIKELYDGCTKC
jgi:hypothetical protein